ncbi:MAG: hypothetical protein JSV43_00465 [Methanobacteriota archaeon]|nr:MAG: hypothetical protein JSV43_00465 [Euryarchaeota archaeon]
MKVRDYPRLRRWRRTNSVTYVEHPTRYVLMMAYLSISLLLSVSILLVCTQTEGDIAPEFELAPDTSGFYQSNPSLVVTSSGVVYVAWDEEIDGASEIFVTRSVDGADTFEQPIQLTDSNGQSDQTKPVLGLGPGSILVVAWEDRTDGDSDVYVSKSEETWGSFAQPVEASDGPDGSDQIYPSLAVDGLGNIHVAWEDLRADEDIRTSSASTATLTFGASVKVNDDAGNSLQHEPSISVDENNHIYIAWYDRREFTPYIYVSKSTDGGTSYIANIPVDNQVADAPQFEPSIKVSNGEIFAVWQDRRDEDGQDIYFASASVQDLAFSDGVRVSGGQGPFSQHAPNLYVGRDDTIHVVWEDFRGEANNIYYAFSKNGGQSFVEEKANSFPGSFLLEKSGPELAVDSQGLVYIVWEDERTGDSKIMMATGSPGGDGEDTDQSLDPLLIVALIIPIIALVVAFWSWRIKKGQD